MYRLFHSKYELQVHTNTSKVRGQLINIVRKTVLVSLVMQMDAVGVCLSLLVLFFSHLCGQVE